MGEQFDRLKQRLGQVHSLNRALAVLSWDQHTHMPPGGARARAQQMSDLARMSHDIFIADETGELLQAAAQEVANLSPESDDASLVRVAQRDYEQARRVPSSLVAEIRHHAGIANPIWVKAREENDFESFAPCLEETVRLCREMAEHLGYEDRLYDALLDQFEPGMKTADVQRTFDSLKDDLVPLVQAIAERTDRVDNSVLHQPYDETKQEQFGKMVVERFGYNFSRGALDRTVHPFAISFSRDDARITTRFDPNFVAMALFGTMHEAGHAMYEQGTGESLEGTLLARGTSLGFHESQSRLWENVVGRSLPFWRYFYPELQSLFPQQLGDTPLETFYGAINKVQPSYIRVEADEVTYNLHIMIRFEMELDLLEGRVSVQDAPEAWNARMESYLGIRPPSNTLGILQDTHWSGASMGYFPTYALGNILSVQLYDSAVQAVPEIPEQIARGEFHGLHSWLTENVYQHGRKFEPIDLIQRVTGQPMHSEPYVAYLNRKFGEIYGL